MALASQKRSTTSGPKNVTKTESSAGDDAGTVKTLIINFARYYTGGISLDRFPIVPLEDQFRNITRQSPDRTDESTYFTKFLYAGSKRVVRIFLSHPAFDKIRTRGKGAALYNVAVRITPPQGANRRIDLVLLGNFEYHNREDRWEYCVTGFYTERSTGRYFGELEAQVKIVSLFRNSDDSYPNFDTDGRLSTRRVGVPGKSNFITEHLADRLCRSYTVPNYRTAEDNISEWQAFLDHIEMIKGESGFPIDRPEFFHVYGVPEGREVDPQQVVFRDNGIIWTKQLIQGAPQRAVAKITHTIDPAMSPAQVREYLQQFNEMSRNLPMVVDPLVEKERLGTVIKKEERERWSNLSHIGTIYDDVRRVSVLPEEDVRQLKQNRDAAVAEIHEGAAERLSASLEAAVKEYLSSEKGVQRTQEHMAAYQSRMDAFKEDARTEIAEDRYGQALSEGREASMAEIRAGITDEECTAAAEEAVMGELTDAVRQELMPSVRERCDEEVRQAVQAADRKLGRKLSKLAKKKGTNILEAYYRLPADPNLSIEEEISVREMHFGKLVSFVLKDDEVLNRATVRRLNEALTVVRDGSMRNPYMMSFIYLPEFVPAPYPEKINHYFGTGFNEYQKQAISAAVGANGIYMIQGPPGTGKTQVIAEIAAQEVVRGRKVLITSQGNKAVDNAFERINRYGFIRPLRIMSMSKESDYDISSLLPSFYGKIRESIGTRLKEFGDADFLARVRGNIGLFHRDFARYQELEAATKGRRSESEKKAREAVNDIQHGLQTQKRKFESAYSEYYMILDKKERLAQFDVNELGDRADGIRSMFPWIPAENTDDMLFGPGGACRALTAMAEEDASDLSAALQDPARYLEVSGWTVSRAFAKGDPASIPSVRGRLLDILSVAESELRADTETSERRIAELLTSGTDEVVTGEEDMDDPEIREFLSVREGLLQLASSIFDDLHITESYDDVETAKAVIDDADAMMSYFEADTDRQMFSDIDTFLSAKGVEKRDADQILRGISDNINVFGITCTANLYVDTGGEGAGNRSNIIDLRRCGIDTVIIDEVSKVPFSELIRPIAFCRKVIMVGDHRQLPPVYIDEEADEELSRRFSDLYSDSLFRDIFERVPEASRVMLRMQYRMARQIMEVVNMFYDEPLEMPDGVPEDWRAHRMNIPGILREDCSVLFIDVKGGEGHKSGSTSVFNAKEAEAVAKMVKLLDENCRYDADGRPLDSPDRRLMTMGVITPYRDQNLAIARELRMDPDDRSEFRLSLRQFQSEGEEGFKVKSVDDFQGDERDVIILSLVRTKSSAFISDFRRINVAMSRARRLLVIIGNADVLAQQEVDFGGRRGKEKVYASIIGRVRQNGGFIDGTVLIGEAAE